MKNELKKYDIDEGAREREISFCQFEIDEINNAHLKKGEFDDLPEQAFYMVGTIEEAVEKGTEQLEKQIEEEIEQKQNILRKKCKCSRKGRRRRSKCNI